MDSTKRPFEITSLRRKPKVWSTFLRSSLDNRRHRPRRRTLRKWVPGESTHPHSTRGRRQDSSTPPALFGASEDETTEFRSRKPRTWVCSPAGSRDFSIAPPRAPRTRSPDGRRGASGERKKPGKPGEATARPLSLGGREGARPERTAEGEEREGDGELCPHPPKTPRPAPPYLWRGLPWSSRCRWCRGCPRSGSPPWR